MTEGAPPDAAELEATLLTIRDFLRYATGRFTAAGLAFGHGTTTALDEAAFLILETLHLPIDRIDPFLDARLLADERRRLAAVIGERVASRRPAAYLTGAAYIQGFRFRVDERVIVPRSYIGELIAPGGAWPDLAGDPDEVRDVLELCTGSGCLAILAAHRFPGARVDAVDLSAGALEVAAGNVADYGLEDRVRLLAGDLYGPVKGRRYDLIIANPPYVAAAEVEALPAEYRHEPRMALAGGEDGLEIVRRILAGAAAHLREGGGLVCEIGTGRELLEADYPDLAFLWLDTEESAGEVFWLDAAALEALPEA